MKTHPSQRKFGLPVAMVASAHAILFLGFRHPNLPPPIKDKPPVIDVSPFPPVEEPMVDVTPGEAGEKTPTHGEPTPDIPDSPVVIADPTAIPILVEPTSFSPSSSPVHFLPMSPSTANPGPHRISSVTELDSTPHAVSRMSPIYPTSMKAQGITGTVTVMFTVDTTGHVSEVSVVSSTHHEFEEAALRAVSHWRFEPGKRHNRPTAFRMSIPLNFVLDN